MEKLWIEFKSCCMTLGCFLVALLLMPILLVSFLCARFVDKLFNYILSIKYPNLTISKSKKIRTLIDTPKNAGVFHFLLQVEGSCDFDRIQNAYATQLIELRDKMGMLRFPKLRQALVNCWGHYGWVNDMSGFNINNHVLLGANKYRGRDVNDSNIQEYVSELATKYIPSDLPQWQVIVIPTTPASTVDQKPEPERYYILVKLHHLILAEEEDLHVSEMLLLQDTDKRAAVSIEERPLGSSGEQSCNFVRQPKHIRNLVLALWHLVVCRWEKFIYEFESLDTPDGYARVQVQNLSQLLSLTLIVLVNVFIGYWRLMSLRGKLERRSSTYRNTKGRLQTLHVLLRRETAHRRLSWEVARTAIAHSLQPSNVAKTWTKFVWRFNMNNVLLMPYHGYCEVMAFRDVFLKGQTSFSNTYCARLHLYVPLVIYAWVEMLKICYELYKAPRSIFEVLLRQPTRELNVLHKKSYAGRKIIAFSHSIDGTALRTRHKFNDQMRESDFSLSCLAGAVYDYFKTFEGEMPVPQLVNTTCRTVFKSYFNDRSGDNIQHVLGVVFLQLPLRTPDTAHIQELHRIVERIQQQQIMMYLASIGQSKYSLLTMFFPNVLTKIFLNFFSYNFPIAITEIYGPTSDFQSAWGQRVEDVLLFRPPQSKTSLSLNLHRFGDKYRLAIMADTHLGPNHSIIARSYEKYMERSD